MGNKIEILIHKTNLGWGKCTAYSYKIKSFLESGREKPVPRFVYHFIPYTDTHLRRDNFVFRSCVRLFCETYRGKIVQVHLHVYYARMEIGFYCSVNWFVVLVFQFTKQILRKDF